ncbi:MinD/ParA family ATP-binding protein [Streptomyces sp. NBC_00696]|uniref:MinD/ParA family ATP-binding protein n=1 Tax=Streptomyces sp. NBC_00696 TaxID=2903672 RepID=UPI002E31C4BF|nr:GTPase domain-containing protein [Streptomyces sp. NBC_00696]
MTTATVGLAAGWPSSEPRVVVECDPAGGDLLGRYRLETAPGLVSLAAAARHRGEPGLVWQHTQRLPGRLPVVVGPTGADQARAALAQLTQSGTKVLRRAANRAGTVVIADCGRIDPESPALSVVREADIMLLLARAHDDALAHVATQWHTVARWSRSPHFLLVGDGYPTDEVARALDINVMARIPEDPLGAAVLGGRPGRRSAPARSPLGRSMVRIAELAASRALLPHGPADQEQSTDFHSGAAFYDSPASRTCDLGLLWSEARR